MIYKQNNLLYFYVNSELDCIYCEPHLSLKIEYLSLKIKIIIISDPPDVTPLVGTVHANVGWSVNVTCKVWSDPVASVTWYRGVRTQDRVTGHTLTQQEVRRQGTRIQSWSARMFCNNKNH